MVEPSRTRIINPWTSFHINLLRQEKKAIYHDACSIFKPRNTDIVKTQKNKKVILQVFFHKTN